MANTILDFFDSVHEFEEMLHDAEACAKGEWEETFVNDITERFYKFDKSMYLSDAQYDKLKDIANRRA